METKVNFVWSFIYQSDIHSIFVKTENFDLNKYESFIMKFKTELEKEWLGKEREILTYMEEISGLKWKEKKVDCYLIKRSIFMPISVPLTIPIELEHEENIYPITKERFIDTLVHELIHILFFQNENIGNKYFDYLISKRYSKEQFNTAIHVPVHAIHKKIFLKFFKKDRFEEELRMSDFYQDYKKAWDIVNEEGEDEIIEELRSYVLDPNAKA